MVITRQWAVVHYRTPTVPHRGPFDNEEDARTWVEDAENDGFRPGAFLVASREVGPWVL